MQVGARFLFPPLPLVSQTLLSRSSKYETKNVFGNAPLAALSNKAQNTAQGTKDILQAGGRVHLCRCCTSYQLKHTTSPAVTRTFSSQATVAQSAPVWYTMLAFLFEVTCAWRKTWTVQLLCFFFFSFLLLSSAHLIWRFKLFFFLSRFR